MNDLNIPIPPVLEEAVGYAGKAHLLSLSWTPLGDTVWYDDGRASGTGYAWAYLAFVRHPAIAPRLAPYDLGSSEQEGPHRLLIDRVNRVVSAGTAAEVRAVLAAQWPREDPVELTPEEWAELAARVAEELASRPMPTASQVMEAMRRRAALVAGLVAWLDRWHAGEETP